MSSQLLQSQKRCASVVGNLCAVCKKFRSGMQCGRGVRSSLEVIAAARNAFRHVARVGALERKAFKTFAFSGDRPCGTEARAAPASSARCEANIVLFYKLFGICCLEGLFQACVRSGRRLLRMRRAAIQANLSREQPTRGLFGGALASTASVLARMFELLLVDAGRFYVAGSCSRACRTLCYF